MQCACVLQSAVRCKHCGRVVAITSNERCNDCNTLEEGGSTQPPLPPTGTVGEKEESGLSKMLTELNLADKYLHKLESQAVNINGLQETLKLRGDLALERLLEQGGVDKAGDLHTITNHLHRVNNLQLMTSV